MHTDEDKGKKMEAKRLEDEERDRAGQERTGSGLLRIFWVFVVIIVLYVLSIGPVVRMSYRSTTADWLLVIYTPLEYPAYYSRTASRFLKWYIEDVWGAKGATGL